MTGARALAALLVACAACKRAPPPQPRFCDQDLTGIWVNASDHTFAYRLNDHGDAVRGKFFRLEADGGEAAPEPGEDPLLIDLHRTSTALAGTMKTMGETRSGRRCPVEFGLKVSSCAGDTLQAVAEMSLALDDDCSRKRAEDGGEIPPNLVEFVWERTPPADRRGDR
jgi:hypothetical protein